MSLVSFRAVNLYILDMLEHFVIFSFSVDQCSYSFLQVAEKKCVAVIYSYCITYFLQK